MHIHLNTNKCQGHLRCMDIAPEIFECDDLGYGVVTCTGLIPESLEYTARRCAANCPEKAISLR